MCFVGRQARLKGLDLIFEALMQMTDRNIKIEFTVVTNELKDNFNIPVIDNVNIIWFQEMAKNEVLDLMKKNHIYIMPSRMDSYGLVFIEAMANGCAVIAPNWEAQSDIFDDGDCGILVGTDDSSDIAKAISALQRKELRINYAKKALNKYKNDFAPEVVSRKHYDIFCNVIKSKLNSNE